jgi:hypothetical protein
LTKLILVGNEERIAVRQNTQALIETERQILELFGATDNFCSWRSGARAGDQRWSQECHQYVCARRQEIGYAWSRHAVDSISQELQGKFGIYAGQKDAVRWMPERA